MWDVYNDKLCNKVNMFKAAVLKAPPMDVKLGQPIVKMLKCSNSSSNVCTSYVVSSGRIGFKFKFKFFICQKKGKIQYICD